MYDHDELYVELNEDETGYEVWYGNFYLGDLDTTDLRVVEAEAHFMAIDYICGCV